MWGSVVVTMCSVVLVFIAEVKSLLPDGMVSLLEWQLKKFPSEQHHILFPSYYFSLLLLSSNFHSSWFCTLSPYLCSNSKKCFAFLIIFFFIFFHCLLSEQQYDWKVKLKNYHVIMVFGNVYGLSAFCFNNSCTQAALYLCLIIMFFSMIWDEEHLVL